MLGSADSATLRIGLKSVREMQCGYVRKCTLFEFMECLDRSRKCGLTIALMFGPKNVRIR